MTRSVGHAVLLFAQEFPLEFALDGGELRLVEGVKVRVLEGVRGVNALRRVVHEKLVEQIDAVFVELRDQLCLLYTSPSPRDE